MKNDTPKFIADCHLGKLAKYLRIMGFDTLFFPTIEDDELIVIANEENRIILTRDRELSQRKNAPVLFLEPIETKGQLKTLIDYYHLKDHHVPFSRCIVCNTPLQIIEKETVLDKLPEKVKSISTILNTALLVTVSTGRRPLPTYDGVFGTSVKSILTNGVKELENLQTLDICP